MSIGQDLYIIKRGKRFYGRTVGGYTTTTIGQGLWALCRKRKSKGLAISQMEDNFEKWFNEEEKYWAKGSLILKGSGSLKALWKEWKDKVDVLVYQPSPKQIGTLSETGGKVVVRMMDLSKKVDDLWEISKKEDKARMEFKLAKELENGNPEEKSIICD